MPGGKAKVDCYAVTIPGDRVVSHEFTEWAVGDWRREVEAQLCATSIGISETNTESLFGYPLGARKQPRYLPPRSSGYKPECFSPLDRFLQYFTEIEGRDEPDI
jgi:hypothetical protein